MSEENLILEFEQDGLWGEAFSVVDIPEKWREGDHICELNGYDILNALEESADYVDEDVFEDGGPGMSGAYYKVYARDEVAFRAKLTKRLLALLEAADEAG